MFCFLYSSNPSVFAYAESYNEQTIVVIGNLNFRNNSDVVVTVPKLENKNIVLPVKIDSIPISGKGSIKSTLNPGEIQVLLINDLGIK